MTHEQVKQTIAATLVRQKQQTVSAIESYLITASGGGGANYADVSRVITAVAYEAAEGLYEELKTNKRLSLVVNGMSIVIDSTSNGFDDAVNQGNPDAIAKAIAEGLIAGAAAYGVSIVLAAIVGSTSIITVGGIALTAYVLGNQVASLAGQGWEYLIGPNSDVTVNKNKNDITILSEGSINDILHHYWDGSIFESADKRMDDKATWIIGSLDSNEWAEKTGDNSYAFSNTLEDISRVGKEYDSGALFDLVKNYLDKEDIANGFYITTGDKTAAQLGKGVTYIKESKSSLQGLIQSDAKAQYAVWKLEPFVFENAYENLNLNLNEVSNNYISDRLDFYISYTNVINSAYYYYDVENGKHAGDSTYYSGDFPVDNAKIGFAENGNLIGSGYGDRLYGGSGNNTIYSDSDFEGQGADYIEGGLGSDTIYSGGKGDLIYTNINLDGGKVDNETSLTVNTVYAGDGGDRVYGSNGIDIIYADSDSAANPNEYDNKDLVEGRGGSDKIYGGDGRDTLYADSASSHADTSGDYIVGGLGADIIHGSDGNDTIYGDNEGDESSLISSDKDVIHGYGGSDTLYGGSDKDTLIGGMENGTDDGASDHLEGGEGFDTYVVNNGDTLYDSDGKGLVKFDNIDLTGTKEKVEDGKYKDDDYYYYCDDPKSKGTLTVTTLDGSRSITISDWSNENLGIKLVDNKDIEVSITESASASEGDSGKRSLYFTVTLSRALEDGESLDVSVSGTDEGSYTFTGGEQSKTFTYSWNGNTYIDLDRIVTLTPTASYDGLYDDVKVTVQNSGTATIYDDDEDKRHDPLALDINQDGFISTTDLDVSGTYFDITGDGLKERVGWIKSEDALLTYDKNENDNIDGIDEVFGNLSESGFEELKRLIDSNHDNVIDRRDELFNRLQVWNDLNQDAKVQDGELQSLKDAGITSIDLNYVSTNIEINGNLLTEASKYTDADGNKELAADIQLATDAKDTKLDLEDIPDFTIDPATELLPQLRGTGLVYDSLVLYNLNPEFKALAQEMSTNLPRIATEFDTFMEQYSGYTAYVNELGEKYSQDGFEMQELDKQAWIVERFEATDKYKKSIENYYNTSLSNGKIPTWAITNSTTVTLKYKALEETLESAFAIQSVYGDVFSDTHYDLATQSFVVNDQNNLETKIADYFNSDTHTIDEKLYLAKVMHLQQNSLEFDIDTILTSIDNNITRELARYVYTGEEATLFETKNSYATDGIIVTSDEDELISTTDKGNKIVLGAGDDKLISGKGNDKFYFRRGDGSDTIFDKGGVDILTFDNGITREDVEIRLNRNSDLVIAIKEDGKTFDEYSDKVTLVDWMKSSNRVERIEFGDGNTLKFQDVFELFEATDGVDAVQLSSRNDILNTKDGNDVIVALDGNDILIGGKGDDRLDGGLGNDTYVYGKGDGKDTIIDSGGYDAVQFTEGITADDLVVEYQGNDLLIGLKEDGKTFEELSDVITLKNYKNSASTIEAIYLDGYQSVDIDALLNAPTEFDDTLELSNNDQNIDLLAGDDTVTTGSGDDTVHGNSGNDTIKTGSGNDILAGDSGDDTLEGGLGDDTYIFNLGDGKDTIYDDYSYGYNNIQQDNAGNDTLVFGEGITADDIVIEYYGNDLMIGIKDGDKSFGELSDVITIQNYVNKNNKIENILLSDGVSIEIYNFNQGTNGADNISLSSESEDLSIAALNGIDFVSTGSGNDDIDGGSGDDDLYSGDGDDLLVGGIGDDLLVGGSGDDTYFFNRNDGSDVIFDDNRHTVVDTDGLGTLFGQANWLVSNTYASDEEQLDGGNDTIQFGEGIVQEDISFAKQANDLQVSIDNGGRILIKNYFNQYNIIENFLLADGTSVELPVLEEPVIPSTGDDTYTFNRSDESLIIFDQGGADTLSLGDGIAQDDIVGKQIGSDFIIGIKEDGKSFDELTNKIVIKNYTNNINRIETILFTDGTQIATESLKIATQEDDILSFGNESRTIDGLAGDDAITTGNGNDTIIGGAGNDTLNGGAGNDTYIFNRVDGKDIITYSYGNDTLKFAEGIVAEDLEARFVGSNLVIGIKEDGVAFEDWSDKVTIQSNFINNIVLNDSTLISLSSIITKPTEDNDNLNFAYLNEAVTVDGLAGDDNITTGNGNDTIIGGAGNDTLNGGAGDDILEGGTGNDTLIGGYGNDTYIFNRGDGKDIIVKKSYESDTLQFAEGIVADDLEARLVGNDLVIGIKEDGVAFEDWSDKVTIQSNFINNIVLNDSTLISLSSIMTKPTEGDDILDYTYTQATITVDGLAGDDTITTSSGDDMIYGGDGNDTISSGVGSDTIDGGSGSDKLYAGAGNDTIIGGTGDDILDGGAGNDIYRFNRGDGKDMLSDSAGNDDIVFGDGITVDDVLFKQDNYDLTIALKADGVSFSDLTDKIIIADWFKQKNNIETIHFTDGSSMSASEIATILTDAQTDTLYSKQGAEIFGGMGDDTYVYKKGDFTVIIDDKFTNKEIAVNAGNDTLKFEDITQDKVTLGIKGDDLIIKIDADHDTYTELKDYVVVRDWKNPNRGIESIEFGDGEVLAIDKTAIYPELEFDENWITGRYYIYGSEDNNINGSKFSEEMESGAGNDVIDALAGNDYLIGGSGDDTINGGSGNDTYVFNIGDGHDTIFDTSGLDSIKFGSSIIRSDIVTTQVGTDLIMTLGANDSITLKDWFNEETIDHRVELMVLENEGEMAIADFLITPTEQNDNLEYGDEKNHIDALAGDDIIYIGGGDDVLFGGEGNDLLYGEDGDDTIAGDQGDDTLYGGEGDDIYLFGRGDGQDIIVENDFTDWSRSGNDTLKFKDGVTPDDLVLVENGEDLIVALKEDGKSFDDLSDKITLKKWALYDDENSRDISRDYYTVENFSFNDGTTWSMNDIISHIGSDENEDIAGFNQADTIEGKKGDDKLYGHLGDDTYVFNRGDGHDTIYDYGRKGDNYSYYNAGNDTLKFGEGITEDDLNITKYNNDVIIFIKDGNTPLNELEDSIIIKDWFISNNRIENMVLSDGTEIDYVKYLSIEPTIEDDSLIYGTGDDYVDALAGDDIVIALGGNNIINGNSGNDTIQTADGNDLLIGGDGNDTLDAGAGDDRLEGGLGDDTYIFNRGDGSNIVDDQDGLDSLKFGLDITQDDLVLYQDGNNLVVALKEDGVATLELQDKITLTNWLDASTRVENITFSDASVWDVPTMMSHLGSDGNDIIQSIELDDTLHGGEGNDTYIFNIGDGHDVIVDTNGTDKLLFGEGITVDDLLIKQDGNDLIVALKEDGVVFSDLANKITISNWTSQDNRVETIELADGTVLNANNVIEHIPSEEADTIVVPDELAVNIDLQGGDDVIQGSSQDDTILGGSGDDVISSGAGNDTLEGGTGDDTLHGGEGNDTYIFNIGDGHDVIVDTNGTDKLTFGSNITINDLTAQMDGNDIQIGIKEDGKNFAELTDVITIKDVMTTNTVNKIAFTNGQTFTKEQLYSMFIQQEVVLNFKTIFINGDDQNNILTVPSSSLSVVNGNGGNDEVNGNDGNDSLIGGAGDDYLDGGDGSDGYFYAVGDGKDIILDSGNSNTYSTINDALSFRSYEISNELMQGGYAYIEKNIGAQQYFASNFYVSDNTNYLFQTSQANVKIRIYSEEWQGFTSDGVKEVFTEVYTDENGKFVWNSSNNLGQPFVSIVIENISTEEMPVDLFVAKADEYDAMPRAAVPKQIGSDNDIIYFNLNGTMDSRVIAYIDGDDYVIAVSEDGVVREDLSNQIRIKNWQNSDNQIEKICFAYPDSCLELTYDNFLALAESQSLFEYANSRSEETIMGTNDDDIGDGSLYGSNSIDDIYGLDGSDSLYGNGGNDILWGDDERNYFSGNDTLYGGDGNDTLYGGRGNDTLWGDNGGEYHPSETDDAFYFYNEENMYYGGDDILYGGDGDDLLFGEGGNDILYGDNETGDYYGGNNTLYGGYGDDTLIGGLSHDSLYGGGGNDILLGDNRNDVFYGGSDDLYGGEGDDTLEGGIFDDNLYGGMGNDTYVVNLGDGYDTIYDDGSDPTYKIIYDDGGKPYQEQIQAPEVSKQDVIRLTSSVTSINDVHVELEGDDLLITVFHPSADGYDNIIRVRFGRYEEHTVETIELSNGETYNIADYFGINLTPGSYPTPIVLDLNGDGVTSVSLDDSNAYFDYNGDGLREHTAWAQRDDAMLVADLNGDGIINDATEHFGNSTRVPDGSIAQSGYEALAQYDTNGDNIIDNKDEAFGNLSLWQDKNQNGKTEEGELTNIQLTNVTAINLTQENGITFEQEMENGNLILNETNYKTFDGEGIIRDVGFAFNAMDTITNNDTLTTEFYGTTLSGADGDDKYIYNITDGDVVIDDNGSGDDTLVLQGITSDQAIVKWDKGTNNIVIGIKENEYDTSSFATLQNHIAIQRFFNESGSIEKFEFDDVILDKSQLYDILLNTKDTLPLTARVLDENSELTGGAKNDILYGTTGDEALSGNDGADYLNGLSGDDLLDGGYGDDTFIGGKGDDTLVDFGGDDFYIFNKGDGRDIVTDFTGDDIIMFGDDIVSSDVVFTQSGNDMILSFEYDKELPLQQRDSITIKNWQQDGFEIETLTFTNGESFSISRLETIKNNTAPELAADASSYTLQDVREMNGDVGATDEDGDTLTYTVTATAQHGTLSVDESGTWTYKVDELYMGEDSAVITVDDGNGGTVTKTLTFHTKVSVPSITTSEIDLKEDNLTTDTLSVTNPVGGTLTYEIVIPSANGNFSVDVNGVYSYDPNQDYNGADEVTIKVTNEYGLSTTTTLSLAIEAVNDAPVANMDSATIEENTQLVLNIADILANDTDVDTGDTMNITDVTIPTGKGVVSLDNTTGEFVFAPGSDFDHLAAGESEEVYVAYTIADAAGATSTSEIVITVTGTNDAPILEVINPIETQEDTAVILGNITSTDADDNATATYSTTETVAGFTLNSDGSYSFNPADDAYQSLAKDEIKEITIPITVTDDQNATDTKSLVITLMGTNDVPTVVNASESFTLTNIRNIDGKVEASDIDDSDVLTYGVSTQAQHGVVTVDENGNWYYKADGSFNGDDSAVITVDDGNGGSVTSMLNFTVKGYIYEGEDLVIDDVSGDDTLVMDNVDKDMLSFLRDGDNLLIKVQDQNTITLKNYFTDTNAGVNALRTAQGDIILTRDVINSSMYGGYMALDSKDHLISGDKYSNWLLGNNGNDIIIAQEGCDYISGGDGDDLLIGGDGNDNINAGDGDDNIYAGEGNDYIDAGRGNDTIIGGSGKDFLVGNDGDDWISGGSGSDTLYGGNGNDTLKGGSGDDLINGDSGSDTYLFNIGDGNDTVVDTSWYGSNDTDKIIFGEGISKDNLQILRKDYDLVFKANDNDSVTVKYWFGSDQRNTIEQLNFSDGSTFDLDEVNSLALTLGSDQHDWISGLNNFDDHIYAKDGNDSVYSFAGDDFISGGKGDDFLEGGSGSDTYVFDKGDGHDTINEWASWGADSDVDTIKFSDNITKEDVSFTLNGTNLLVQYGDNDIIKVANTYNANSPIERIELSDGNFLTNNDIDLVIQQINAYGCEKGMHHISNNDIQNNAQLTQIVSSAWHQ